MDENSHKKLVGFFPPFFNLAETGRAVLIAKRYRELGGNAIFFSHGGKFEFLARDNGFKIISIEPILNGKDIDELFESLSLNLSHSKILHDEDWLLKNVTEEIKAYKKSGIKLLVSTNSPTCAISAKAAKIPYVNVSSGPGNFAISVPDDLENIFTRLFPQSFKVKLLNWYIVRSKWDLKTINKVAKKLGIPQVRRMIDICAGDLNLGTNYSEFTNVFPNQQDLPKENYIGMILLDELFEDNFSKDEAEEIYSEIKKHINRKGRSILVSLGSSGTKEIFLRILKTLNKTDYNVVAIHSSILDNESLKEFGENILLKKFVPSIGKVNKMVDLAIIHGGQGTVFTAVYSKKPTIGFPMHFEQHINLEKLTGHGSGIMLSIKYFSEKKLLDSINKIFNNYDFYLVNAQKLGYKIPPPNGDKRIAKIIYDIVNNKNHSFLK